MDAPDRQCVCRSRQPTCQRKSPAAYGRQQLRLQHEPIRQCREGSAATKSFFSSLKADPLSGKRIAPEATLAQMRLITASNSTVRSDFGVCVVRIMNGYGTETGNPAAEVDHMARNTL